MTKLCECGCGESAPISAFTSEKQGYVRGEARRFVYGHWSRTKPSRPLLDRFMEKVKKTATCWLYSGPTGRGGYGYFFTGKKKDGDNRQSINTLAHRWAYEHFVGPIPEGLLVLHSCDVPNCVNPDHLRVGTQLENVADCVSRGRRGNRWGYRQVAVPSERRQA